MSYYGVSVLITILVTSLIAFYLLYKARELNLGVVISISIGSIILGLTFDPAFKAALKLLSDNININKKLALVISLLIVLFVFLLFILIVSVVISICIPKKLASTDCCAVIDRLISKNKNIISNAKCNLVEFFSKIASNMKEIAKSVYNLKNKLKKPVDTKQIIDTMGIEKSNNAFLDEGGSNSIDTSYTLGFENLIGFMEPSGKVAYENQVNSTDEGFTDEEIIDQDIEANESTTYNSLAATAYQEVCTTLIPDVTIDEVEEKETSEADLNRIQPNDEDDTDDANEINDADDINDTDDADVADDAVQFVIDDEIIDSIDYHEEMHDLDSIIDANSLVLKAFECKDDGRKGEAIEHYIEALQYEPNSEMIFWIVLDVCALYKQLGLSELAKSILEGLVSEYGDLIQPEIKMEIMNNLK